MEYRWYIGKELDTDVNLIDLTQADWVEYLSSGVGAIFNWAADQVGHAPGVGTVTCDAIETVANIFTVGETYQITYNYTTIFGNSAVKPYVGDFTIEKWESLRSSEPKVFDAYCRAGRKMRFSVGNSCVLDTLTVYPYVWMPVLDSNSSPVFETDKFLTLRKSEQNLKLFVKSIQGVKFYGASYTRLMTLVNNGVYNIPVKIQLRQSKFDAWGNIFEGIIYANEINWDTKTRTATADVEDGSESDLLLKNLDKETRLAFYSGRRWNVANPVFFEYLFDSLQFHDPSDGSFILGGLSVIRVDEALREVLYETTDLKVGLISTTLTDSSEYDINGVVDEYAGLTNARLIRHPFENAQWISIESAFRDMMQEYHNLFAVYGYMSTTPVKNLVVEKLSALQIDSGIVLDGIENIIIEGFKNGQSAIDVGFTERNYKGDSGVVRIADTQQIDESVLNLTTRYFAGNDYYQKLAGVATDIYQNYHARLCVGETPGGAGPYLEPIKNHEKTFLIEYKLFEAAQYRTIVGTNDEYNPRFDIESWLNRHELSLPSFKTYKKPDDIILDIYSIDNGFQVQGTDTFIYKASFETVLPLSDYYTILGNPFAWVTIQSDNINPFTNVKINSKFIIEKMEYNPDDEMAIFEGYMT